MPTVTRHQKHCDMSKKRQTYRMERTTIVDVSTHTASIVAKIKVKSTQGQSNSSN